MKTFEKYLEALESGDMTKAPTPVTRLDKRLAGIVEKYLAKFTNVLRNAITETGEPYGTNGYKAGVMLSDDSKTEIASEHNMHLTGYIPAKNGDIVRIKNITFKKSSSIGENGKIYFYDSEFRPVASQTWTNTFEQDDTYESVREGTIKNGNTYMRIFAYVIDDSTIITVNEEIE